jgi:hypothetical protein
LTSTQRSNPSSWRCEALVEDARDGKIMPRAGTGARLQLQ